MKSYFHVFNLFALFLFTRIACDEKIFGGEEAEEHEFPHHVSLTYGRLWESTEGQRFFDLYDYNFCQGGIIDSRTIVTAAHCLTSYWLYNKSDIGLFAFYGSSSLRLLEVNKIVEILIHPDYVQERDEENKKVDFNNDVALVFTHDEIEEDPPKIQYLKLRRRSVGRGKSVKMSGFGSTYAEGNHIQTTPVLRKLDSTVVACDSDESYKEVIRPHKGHLCIRSPDNISPFLGDSGSPLVLPRTKPDGRYSLIGVMSNSDLEVLKEKQGTVLVPTGFSFFSKISYHYKWIAQNMKSKPYSGDWIIYLLLVIFGFFGLVCLIILVIVVSVLIWFVRTFFGMKKRVRHSGSFEDGKLQEVINKYLSNERTDITSESEEEERVKTE